MATEEPLFRVVSFQVEARLTSRRLAIDLVATLVEHVETADGEFCNAMATAFGEAFNNIVIHGYKDRTDGVLEVEAELGTAHMKLTLLDNGVSAPDFATIPAPDLDDMVEGGMGLFMMHSLVDEVDYRPGSPNVLSLTKRTGR